MYKEKLHKQGASDDIVSFVHCTRLTKKILTAIPGIIATRSSQSSNSPVVLTLDGELGKAIFQTCMHSSFNDVLVMADAARRIRKVLFCNNQTFNGDTSYESQASSVPNILIRLISMILEGGKTDRELNSSQTRIACNISQIIKFNSMKEKSKVTTINSRNNEPTLPVVVGLNIHSKTRKKSLIEDLHTKGLSISYEHVMNIRSSMARKINKEYTDHGFVFPHQLHGNHFTSSAIDNFDYNLTFSTATTSVHFNFPTCRCTYSNSSISFR